MNLEKRRSDCLPDVPGWMPLQFPHVIEDNWDM